VESATTRDRAKADAHSTRVTVISDESARRSETSAGWSGIVGSSGLSKLIVTETLSSTVTLANAGGTVSRSITSSSIDGRVVVTVTLVESHFSLRSNSRFEF
jgi:hypothetical protein